MKGTEDRANNVFFLTQLYRDFYTQIAQNLHHKHEVKEEKNKKKQEK